MKELTELGQDEFVESFDSVLDSINDLQRNLSALVLTQYPDRNLLLREAEFVLKSVKCSHVQINAIMQDSQFSLVTFPQGDFPTILRVRCDDSLCVLTVGFDQPLSLTDISNSPYLTNNKAQDEGIWKSWASAPIHVGGYAAGTVCALEENRSRRWSRVDEEALRRAAHVIGERVSSWRTH